MVVGGRVGLVDGDVLGAVVVGLEAAHDEPGVDRHGVDAGRVPQPGEVGRDGQQQAPGGGAGDLHGDGVRAALGLGQLRVAVGHEQAGHLEAAHAARVEGDRAVGELLGGDAVEGELEGEGGARRAGRRLLQDQVLLDPLVVDREAGVDAGIEVGVGDRGALDAGARRRGADGPQVQPGLAQPEAQQRAAGGHRERLAEAGQEGVGRVLVAEALGQLGLGDRPQRV